MKKVVELSVSNTLKNQGVNGIFYEGPIICVSYKNTLVTFRVHKEDQSRTIQRFDRITGDMIDKQTKEQIKRTITANWELVLTSKISVPMRELDREALELNQKKHLDRLDKLCRLNSNLKSPSPEKSYSSIFRTYVTIEENNLEELR